MKRIKVPSLQCFGHKTSLDISSFAGIPAFKPQIGTNALNLLLGLKKKKSKLKKYKSVNLEHGCFCAEGNIAAP